MLRFDKSIVLGLFLALIPVGGVSQELRDNAKPSSSTQNSQIPSERSTDRVNPNLDLIHFVGVYQPDGSFKTAPTHPKIAMLLNVEQGESRDRGYSRPNEVPPFVSLEPKGRVVRNFQPKYHASEPLKGHSLFANLRDQIIVLAYGRQSLFRTPTHVTTDSRQRIIISDTDLSAIHILDPNGKATFRIVGGPRSRFQAPEAIAVDADDNIYVVDASKSAIIVFGPEGDYLRTIGTLSGESRFESLGALAIDRKSRIVYAVDPGANELLLFSLEGRLLNRMGGRSKDKLTFIHPSEVALTENEIIVLDDFGSRVQVFDSQHNLLNSFRVRASDQPPLLSEVGLSSDSTGLIYLSNLFPDKVAVFNHSGKLVALFGRSGNRVEEFKVPSGIWIDGSDRIYIADTENSRVQVFRTVIAEKVVSNGTMMGDSR